MISTLEYDRLGPTKCVPLGSESLEGKGALRSLVSYAMFQSSEEKLSVAHFSSLCIGCSVVCNVAIRNVD